MEIRPNPPLPTTDQPPSDQARLGDFLRAASHVREVLRAGRSDRLLVLFEYLLGKAKGGETVSESDIAAAVFASDANARPGQDANVRVLVHRLRRVLDGLPVEQDQPRLQLPVGEYRLVLADVAAREPLVGRKGVFSLPAVAALAFIAIALGGAFWLWLAQPSSLARTSIWRPFENSDKPALVVMGDYYLFARFDPSADASAGPQLVWDEDVPTREDLTILQMLDPANAQSLVDYSQQSVTGGTIEALGALRKGLAQFAFGSGREIRLIAASQLTPELLSSHDIIYVGLISGMPPLLRDPLSQATGFRMEPGFGGLTDQSSSRRFGADNMVLTDERIARRDYAYIASLPGPADNRLLVVSGLGDAGLKQAMQLVLDAPQMQRLDGGEGSLRTGFEALFRVRTIRNVNVSGTLVLDRPLRSTSIWDVSGEVAPYRPLDMPSEQEP